MYSKWVMAFKTEFVIYSGDDHNLNKEGQKAKYIYDNGDYGVHRLVLGEI